MLKPRVAMMQTRGVASPVRERLRGRPWMTLRERVLRRDPLCVACKLAGRLTQSTECDHVMPIHRGGSDDESNLCGICAPCHRAKTKTEAQARGFAARD